MTYFFPHMVPAEAKANPANIYGWDSVFTSFQVRRHEFREDIVVLDFVASADLAARISNQWNIARAR